MKAKIIHKRTLVEYLSNWENPIPTRLEMATVCGLTAKGLRKHFTPAEYSEIENEGLELRKQRSAIPRLEIYESMKQEAVSGVVQAQKEFLDRTEGKVIDRVQVGMDETTLNTILATLPPEQAEATKSALLAISAGQKK